MVWPATVGCCADAGKSEGILAKSKLPSLLMRPKLLLHLLTARPRSGRESGFTIIAGILVILALIVGTLGVVAIVNGANLGIFGSGEARDSQQVAEAGADQIIATFNQPENRQLLVAGSTPPNKWSTTNTDLQSPCISSAGVRPGTDGFPSTRAVGFADGQFRDLTDVDKTNQGDRRFRLVSVRYSAGVNGSTDRRSIYRTFSANGTALSQNGTIPTATTFNALLNLDDPDGSGALGAGANTGFIAVTVEGRLYRADGTFSTSTITKEYEVLPKCCGGSFGSNASGGTTTGTAPANSLGADSRFCGIEFGMITGINGGRFLSQAANDRYTRRNATNQVVNIGAILGIIADPAYKWDRGTNQVVGNIQVGCRTVPCPQNTSAEIIPGDTSGNTMVTYYNPLTTATPNNCPASYGNAASIAGRAASCIPIVPLYLSKGLPSIASKYTYAWTSGSNPDTVSKQTVSSASPGGYPLITAVAGDQTGTNTTGVRTWIRANSATGVNQVTPGKFLEYCNTRYLPSNACASAFNGSQIHTWAVISRPGNVTGGIGDDLSSYATFAEFTTKGGVTPNSTPRWPSLWTTAGTAGTLDRPGASQIRFFHPGAANTTANWGTGFANAPAIARAVNLHALREPVLEFRFTRNLRTGSTGTNSAFDLDYSFASPITTDEAVATNAGTWTQMATVTANGVVAVSSGATGSNCTQTPPAPANQPTTVYTCRIGFPPASYSFANRFNHYVKFRLRANSNFSNVASANAIRDVTLRGISILSGQTSPPTNVSTAAAVAPQYLNWCEYSSTFPDTATFQGGFHCLGPTIDLRAVGNILRLDTTDESITFYYNRSTDSRGITTAAPLINLFQGGTMANVSCSRANPLSTAPTENCSTLVSENVFNPVGEYDRFNIFGRDSSPANTCFDAGRSNQPCNQIIIIAADSSATSTNRSRIAGAWFYLPWGLVSFCVNGCGPLPQLTAAELAQDDSWNFGGRIWVRTILAGGQNHFRVPPSASSDLTQLVGAAANSADVTYIGWEGVDWVARAPTASRKGFSLN